MKQSIDAKAVQALLAVDLPGTIDPGELPDEIMWMPPGRHKIQATRAGKPVEVDVKVDENAARKIAAAHGSYMSGVASNEEDHPFFDFNHDDQEASGHPTNFRWGGDDPKDGGIRAKVEWTGKGKQALVGRTYRRFSPSFYLDNEGSISGAPINMGGLVNRAAFKRIAPVISKAVEEAVISSSAGGSFENKAKVVAKSRNLGNADAIEVLARERPDLYLEYRISLGLGDSRYNARELARARELFQRREGVECDQFIIESRALAEALEIDVSDAAMHIGRSRPSLYERYRARLYNRDLDRVTVAAVTARAEESLFFAKAKTIAADRNVDIAQAYEIVARENPDLYDAYRSSL